MKSGTFSKNFQIKIPGTLFNTYRAVFYGKKAGTFSSHRDVCSSMGNAMATMSSYIALVSSVTGQELTVLDSAGQNVLN